MLSWAEKHRKNRNDPGKGSSEGKKHQNERGEGAIPVGLLKTVGLYKVFKGFENMRMGC